MKRTPLTIGNLIFEYPFVLAPLAGITDKTMRSLCSQAGASLTYTEMVSAKGLWYGDRKTGELLRIGQHEGPVGFQLFGCEPEILAYAVRILSDPSHAKAVDTQMEEVFAAADPICAGVSRPPMGARTVTGLKPPALFDLNAGCPVPKIVRNGEGSALLKDPDLLYDCVAAMVRAAHLTGGQVACKNVKVTGTDGQVEADSGIGTVDSAETVPIPVTVKFRKGFELDDDCAVEIAKAAEAAGAAAITVHGRTRQQFYEGKADWDAIARVKAAVKIPVIGNGDVYSGADAIRMMEETGCDGVMIARGALGNPWIFRQARGLWDGLPGEDGTAEARHTNYADMSHADTDAERILHISDPSDQQRIDLLLHHLDMVCEDKGERVAVQEMRKHVGWYIKGMRGATQIRRQINNAGTADEMKRILTGLI